MGKKYLVLQKTLLTVCGVLGITEPAVTPRRDLTGLVGTFLLASIPGASQYRAGAGAPAGPPCPGTGSPAAREGVGGRFSTVGQQRCEAVARFFPGPFVGEWQQGRLSRLPRQMLPVTDAAGDVLEASLRRSALRRGRGRPGPGCPGFELAKFLLLLLNERGTGQERKPNGRRQRGGGGDGGGGLSSGLRQQKAGTLSAIIPPCRDGMYPAQARREGAEPWGTGSRYGDSILPCSKGIWVMKERRAQTCFCKVGSCLWLRCNPFHLEGEQCCASEARGVPARGAGCSAG